MPKGSRQGGGERPNALSVAEVRAQIVLDEIRRHPPELERVEDVYDLPRLAQLDKRNVGAALDVLVASGRLVESADGRLMVTDRPGDAL